MCGNPKLQTLGKSAALMALGLFLALAATPARAIRLTPDQIIYTTPSAPAPRGPVSAASPWNAEPLDKTALPLFSDFDVNVVTREQGWSCTLNKNDGSRKDGFEGRGHNEFTARMQAAKECLRTNHPHCYSMAEDPGHTACEQFNEVHENTVSYSLNELPDNAQIQGWKCILNKNDGSRKDGFEGTGQTRDQALAESIAGCERTNNSYCDLYAADDEHTTCAPIIVIDKGVVPY